MRSLLFVPGDSEKKLAKALESGADALIVDLEDSVAAERKAVARGLAGEYLAARCKNSCGPKLIVRINDLGTPFWRADLDMAVAAAADAVMLPKPNGGGDVARLGGALDEREAARRPAIGKLPIIAIATETPSSLLCMLSYAHATPRLSGLAWGREDLSAAIGARATTDEAGTLSSPFRLARDLTLFAAAAAGVIAIDEIHADFRDTAGLERSARTAARDGFSAKMAIHPDQVTVINAAFTPSEAEVAEARAIVDAFARTPGVGAMSIDGRMIDRPHLVRAQRLLARVPHQRS